MSAVLRAITWEFQRENRWWIIIAVSIILGLVSIVYNEPLPQYDSENQISHFTVFILEMYSFGMFLCIGQYNKAKSRLGFLEHLFTKPIRMRSVALIRLSLAVLTSVLLYLLTVWAFYWATHWTWQIVQPCLYMTALIVFVHAMAWSLPAAPALQILFATVGYIVLCMLYNHDLHSTADSTHVFGLLIFIVLSTFLAITGTALDRRSQRLSIATLWSRIAMAYTACLPWKTCTNASPQRALFGFHWIRKGWVLPLVSIIIMIVGFVLSWVHWTNQSEFITIYFSLVFLIHIVGFPLLASLIVCQQETQNRGMPTYLGCLPVTNRDMLLAYLKASLVMTWGIFVIGLGLLCLFLTMFGKSRFVVDLFAQLSFYLDIPKSDPRPPSLFLIHGIYFLLAWAWAAIGLTGSMILSGRRSVTVIAFTIIFLLPTIPALAEGSDIPRVVVDALYVLEAWLYILGIIGGTITTFVYATQKKRIHLYLTGAVVLSYIVLNLINLDAIWRNHSPILESLTLLAVGTLPFAPFATAPLAIAWNRHR